MNFLDIANSVLALAENRLFEANNPENPYNFEFETIEDFMEDELGNQEDIEEAEDTSEDENREGLSDIEAQEISDEEVQELINGAVNFQKLSNREKDRLKALLKKAEMQANTGSVIPVKGKKIDLSQIEKIYQKLFTGDISSRTGKILHPSTFKDENGNPISIQKLKDLINMPPKTLIAQNSKLKSSGKHSNQVFFDSTIPAYQGLFVDRHDNNKLKIVKTCPSAGICKKFCYASKGRYITVPQPALAAARVINFIVNDPKGFKQQLINDLRVENDKLIKTGKQLVLRWHDSGDFISPNYLKLAYEVANETKKDNILHYAYTKQVPLVKQTGDKPSNMILNFSFGGLHDAEIDKSKDKYADVVPEELFSDLQERRPVYQKDGTPKYVRVPVYNKGGVKEYTKKPATSMYISGTNIKELKSRVVNTFKLDPKTFKTYDEFVKLPLDSLPYTKDEIDKNPNLVNKWNVLVWSGHGDDAATRLNVAGVYLLAH